MVKYYNIHFEPLLQTMYSISNPNFSFSDYIVTELSINPCTFATIILK